MTTESDQEVKLFPDVKPTLANLHILLLRRGNDPRPTPVYFAHDGDLNSAIAVGRSFCEKINARFVMVKPFVLNLNTGLKSFIGGKNNYI
jgi:hypothetical protein